MLTTELEQKHTHQLNHHLPDCQLQNIVQLLLFFLCWPLSELIERMIVQ